MSQDMKEIQRLFIQAWDSIELLDETIIRYINSREGEYLSYLSFFNRKFPPLIEGLKGVNNGIKVLEDWDAEDEE